MKKIIAQSIALASVLAPTAVFAQTQLNNVNDVVSKATGIGNLAITLLISFSVIWIIWNVVHYLIMGDDATARKDAGQRILFGVIGLVVILSIWGLVAIFRNSFKTVDNAPETDINKIKLINPPQI